MTLTLKHGSGPADRQARIETRAKAIIQGHPDAEASDPTDINLDEQAEIEAARKLAAEWQSGKW